MPQDTGRILLQVRSNRPSTLALETTVRIARTFHAEIESLIIEDRQLFELAGFPFAREISLSGRRSRALSISDVEHDARLTVAAVRRRVEAVARRAQVRHHARVVRDEPTHALCAACSETGTPWRLVALAEPFGPDSIDTVRQVLASLAGRAGLLLFGPRARRTSGPTIIVLEDVDKLPALLQMAQDLAAGENGQIVILITGDSIEDLQHMEGQVRLILGQTPNISIAAAAATLGEASVVLEAVRRLKGSIVLGHSGGLFVPAEGSLRHLAGLESPLVLVR